MAVVVDLQIVLEILLRIHVVSLPTTYAGSTAARERRPPRPSGGYAAGEKVEGNYQGAGSWFYGTIESVNADGTFTLVYDDGDEESNVRSENIRARAPLPAGYAVGDRLFYNGEPRTFPDGDKLAPGQVGEVMGASTSDSQAGGQGLKMKFPGNGSDIDCFLTTLSREAPKARGGKEAKPASADQPASDAKPAASAVATERGRQMTLGSEAGSMGGDDSIP